MSARTGFLAAAVIGIAYSVVLWWGVRGSGVGAEAAAARSGGSLAELFRSRCYIALSFAFAAFCAIQWIVLAWYPTFLQERFKLSMTDSGWNAAVFVQVSQVLGIFGGSALADRLRRRWRPARLSVAAAGVFGSDPFGHIKGAVPDAMPDRFGRCELADERTLILL